ncbi:methylene-fatty-acyl-phospholipid synthase/demethylmenaquinone methyltransferase [Acididesulfobacillus acetoxydans]|uniref:Demethylmenaquinone methyltransferase n=1 Tax=Acididesulfobacillus acetoxydans TaxID=1561005 RepID=A0A8S0XWG5_9FIRM|nr:demethylmenaquinone methyltransferase [Acididesulfobacillus acetoxydans]CAA7601017.1 methylene-fatty-acyl-phospholipid synthase/demethylmenaquinone methyltransferase [Acididesulfobacillus acetoxydans]CEJ06891.1 Demethylmenaquinone methyltransferase [Acididesulfobacillus acetoxydans]
MDFAGKDKASYVKETFNTIAGRYDFMNSVMTLGLDKRWRRKVVRCVGAAENKHILDVCCGTGQLSLALAERVGPRGRVTGLDFSENMLAKAREALQHRPWPERVHFQRGDALALPFPDNSFDGATVGWGLRNLPDLEQGIREMTRVVKPGAKIVSLDMAKPTLPVFKQVYWFYFERVVPLLGSLFTGKRSAYRYLHDSAVQFPAQRELAQIFARCGLIDTRCHNLAGGAVAIVEGTKAAGAVIRHSGFTR